MADTVKSRYGENERTPNGGFAQRWSDDDFIAAWLQDPSTRKVARALGCSERYAREKLGKLRKDGRLPHADPDVNREGKIAQLGASVPVEVAGGKIKELSVNLWGVAAKNGDGDLVTQGLDGIRAKYSFDEGRPALDVIPHDCNVIAYAIRGATEAKTERIAVVGDMQLGFWAVRSPENPKQIDFVPFHDEAAIDVMMKAIAIYQPHRLVIVGDFLDFPQLSRFQQEPEWAQTMQASIQEAYDLLVKIRKTVGPKCRIDFLLGNHETRITRAIVNGNPALYNLTRPGEKWPVYSVPSLLRFEELGIECSAEYPSGEVWLAQRRGNIPGLVVTHADPKKKDMRADSIHGHLVLPGLETRQVFYEDGPVTYTRMCVSGCGNYSDTGDKVRLTRTNTPSGRARMSAVQSFATVDIDRKTGLRHYALHLIHGGRVQFQGKVLSASLKRVA